MNDDLMKMHQSTSQVLASLKQLENKYKAAERAFEDWYQRAQLALRKGDENLAPEALTRQKSFADNANSFQTELGHLKFVADNLFSKTRLLESKIQEAKLKKDTLKAHVVTAKTTTKLREMIENVNVNGALSAFERMEEKVLTLESEAKSFSQLIGNDLEEKFAVLETSVDDDLEELKKEVSGSSKVCASLFRRLEATLPQGNL